ncbi:unnamed protein product [Macrosiphum euphorbiae]|uniref:Uncharacterized protein n=1 Tax=Macrosiphum euphorbiae TaxID=13131 RepID=A0AAV0YCL5_9HEMI|nr:unnamed protein product [Macrosiphum euphorbiae]
MLKKAKYRRFVEEFVADEVVSVDQNEISMINNINTETENNVFKWPHEAILLLVEEFRKELMTSIRGGYLKKKIGKI